MTFSLCGRRVSIDYLFFALLAFLLFWDQQHVVLPGLAAALCHEAGHIVAIVAQGVPVRSIHVTAFGIDLACRQRPRAGYWQDALLSLAGPLANLCCCVLCLIIHQQGSVFFQGNLLLAVFNLLPIESLDGGQCLYAVLCVFWDAGKAERFVFLLSFFVLLPLACAGFWLLFQSRGNVSLLLAACYLALLLLKDGRFL